MGLPRILQNFNMFLNGETFLHKVAEVTRPKLSRQMEDYRGGGMDAPVKIDMGQEAMEMEVKFGGYSDTARAGWANTRIAGEQLRWVGVYQSDDTGKVSTVEIAVRGRWQEIDPGGAKPGDKNEETGKFLPVYYRETVDGVVLVEIDIMNMVCVTGGIDRLAEQRAALGIGNGPSLSLDASFGRFAGGISL